MALDNWFTSGRLVASVAVPIVAEQVLAVGDVAVADNRQTVQIIAAASVNAIIAVQRIAADGVTVAHEQALAVVAGSTFQVEMVVIILTGERVRVVNKVALTAGTLWVSLILN